MDLQTIEGSVNKLGQIAGIYYPLGKSNPRSYFYSDGNLVDMGNFASAGNEVWVRDLNDLGQAVGTVGYSKGTRAFLYDDNKMVDLGSPFEGISFNYASGVNNAGQIVGSTGRGSVPRATLWEDGEIYDLNDLVDNPGDIKLEWASSINELGQIIAGYRFDASSSQNLLLTPVDLPRPGTITPVPEPSTLLIFVGLALGYAGRRHLRRR
ncbi:MAG: PEP-CTERM sorting domain-containing protein [Singulisphaera sp.]